MASRNQHGSQRVVRPQPNGELIPDGDRATLTFRREYPHHIQHVWDAISTPEGLLLVTVAPNSASSAISGAGVLLVFEVEALAPGAEGLRFDADDVHIVATDGRKLLLKVMTDEVSVAR